MRTNAWLVIVVFGCGGGASTGPVTQETAEDLCSQGCAFAVECDGADLGACVADCVARTVGWVREDALEQVETCLADLSCDGRDDDCEALVEPLPIHAEYATQCEAAMTACVGADQLAVECDPLVFIRFMAPARVEELIACFALADCPARTACADEIFARYGLSVTPD